MKARTLVLYCYWFAWILVAGHTYLSIVRLDPEAMLVSSWLAALLSLPGSLLLPLAVDPVLNMIGYCCFFPSTRLGSMAFFVCCLFVGALQLRFLRKSWGQ